MIKEWFKNSSQVVVPHEEPDSSSRHDGYSRARRIAKFALVAGLSVVMATSGVLNAANNSVQAAEMVNPQGPVSTQQIDQSATANPVRDSIQHMMGEHSQKLDQAVGHGKLVVLSQQDQNLPNIVQNLSSELVPGMTVSADAKISPEYSDVTNSMIAKAQELAASGQPSESISKALYAEFARINDKDAHADLSTDLTTGQRVCYVKTDYDASNWKTGRGLPFQMQDAEMNVAIVSHELAHCQDFDAAKFKDSDGDIQSPIHQMEVVADMTAALMISSRTGNWDYVDHTLLPFRALDRADIDHETSGWVQSMREQIDVRDLSPMNQTQAFDMAQKLYKKMDYEGLRKESFIDLKVDRLYRDFMATGKDPVPSFMARSYLREAKDVSSEADVMKVVENHGSAQLGMYLNHIQYRSMTKDSKVVPPLLAELGKHAEAFGNAKLTAAVDQQMNQWENHGNINLKPLSDALGSELAVTGPARFQDNALAVAKLGQELGLEMGAVKQEAPTMDEWGVQPGIMNAYERFRERMKMEQGREVEIGLNG